MEKLNHSFQKIDDIGEVKTLSILTLIDNSFFLDNLETAWGLSFYIEVDNDPNKVILMDCSGSLYDFSQNVSKLKINFVKLSAIHISHWHSDHCGCLNYIMSAISKSTPIYVPIGNKRAVKEIQGIGHNIIEIEKARNYFKGIFSTGTFQNGISEHSLVFNVHGKGLVIVLGCAHPGVISIIEKSRQSSNISTVYGVIGGFHINNVQKTEELIEYLRSINIQLVSPCHCTGNKAKKLLKNAFEKEYIKNGSGLLISI